MKQKLDEYINKAATNFDLPGLAIGADIFVGSKLNKFSYAGTAGYQDFVDKSPLLPENIFHMASVSKLFTGLSILKLVESGKLSLEENIADYFDFLPFKDVTIKKMITHTAGLGDVADYDWGNPKIDSQALLNYIKSDESTSSQVLEQGNFVYSNIGFEILGSLISLLGGTSYEDFIAENFLEPAGMKDSTFLTFERSKIGRSLSADTADRNEILESLNLKNLHDEGVCTPHVKNENKEIVRVANFPYNREHGPSSTLTSNISDMRKWGEYILDKKVASEEMYVQMWQPYAIVPNNKEHIGLSWFIREQNGYTLYGHEGTDDGFRSSFWICPELRVQITVMSNITKAPVKKINKHVFDMLTLP